MDFKLIADSIPVELLNAAIDAIGDSKVQMTWITDNNGQRVKIPRLDMDGNEIMLAGGFYDLTTVVACFDAIKDLNMTVSKGVYKQTYIGISNDATISVAFDFRTAIQNAITANEIPDFIHNALNTNGVDINNSQVAATLLFFASNDSRHGFTPELVSAVLSTGNIIKNMFPGLKVGHVSNAIKLRVRGEI